MTNFKILSKVIPFSWKKIATEYTSDYEKKTVPYAFTEIYTPYIEREDILNLLNDYIGVENWKTEYYSVSDSIYCKLSIYDHDKKEWISKSDAGESKRDYLKQLYIDFYKKESQMSEEDLKNKTLHTKKLKTFLDNASKTEATSSFKRACSQFGIGLFLNNIKDFPLYVKETEVSGKSYKKKDFITKTGDLITNYYDKTFDINSFILENCKIHNDIFRNCKTIEELSQFWNNSVFLQKNKNFTEIKDNLKNKLAKKEGKIGD